VRPHDVLVPHAVDLDRPVRRFALERARARPLGRVEQLHANVVTGNVGAGWQPGLVQRDRAGGAGDDDAADRDLDPPPVLAQLDRVTLHEPDLRSLDCRPMQADGVAVVTGASRGLGRAVALELAYQGFDVVATMRDPAAGASLPGEAVAASAKGTLRVERLDVTDHDTIRLPEGLRVLVNNAGVEAAHPPFEATPMELWRAMFEANVFGLVEVTRRAIPLLRAAGGGVICNVTSSSILAPVPFY